MVNLNNLFLLIENQGLSASKVSAETGISTGNISDWKKGRSMPTAQKLDILAEYFNCSVDYLLGRTDNPQIAGDIHISSDNGSVSNIGDNANITVSGNNDVDKTTKEFTAIFSSLDLEDRFEVMQLLMKKRKK